MFVKCPCQHCGGKIEYDDAYNNKVVKCPHCFENTRLFLYQNVGTVVPTIPNAEFQNTDIPTGEWIDQPMTEKQQAMFVLFGYEIKSGMSRGDASKAIDFAYISRLQPTPENQAKAGVLFGRIRLKEIIQQLSKIIEVIGDESANIKKLKDAKRDIKQSVTSLTEILDKRIEGIRDVKMEIQKEKLDKWYNEHFPK